jgi:hypothetical protein
MLPHWFISSAFPSVHRFKEFAIFFYLSYCYISGRSCEQRSLHKFSCLRADFRSRHSSVGIAMTYRLDNPGLIPDSIHFFCSPQRSDRPWGLCDFPGDEPSRGDAAHSPPFSNEVQPLLHMSSQHSFTFFASIFTCLRWSAYSGLLLCASHAARPPRLSSSGLIFLV